MLIKNVCLSSIIHHISACDRSDGYEPLLRSKKITVFHKKLYAFCFFFKIEFKPFIAETNENKPRPALIGIILPAF